MIWPSQHTHIITDIHRQSDSPLSLLEIVHVVKRDLTKQRWRGRRCTYSDDLQSLLLRHLSHPDETETVSANIQHYAKWQQHSLTIYSLAIYPPTASQWLRLKRSLFALNHCLFPVRKSPRRHANVTSRALQEIPALIGSRPGLQDGGWTEAGLKPEGTDWGWDEILTTMPKFQSTTFQLIVLFCS